MDIQCDHINHDSSAKVTLKWNDDGKFFKINKSKDPKINF